MFFQDEDQTSAPAAGTADEVATDDTAADQAPVTEPTEEATEAPAVEPAE